MKKLNDALTTQTNSQASKRSRNTDISSSSSKGSHQSSSRSSSKENISSKVPAANLKINVQMHIPSYDGTKGKAPSFKFVQNFLEVMTVNKIESACWGPFLLDCLKRDALSFYKSQKRNTKLWIHSKVRSFKNFFDNRSR